MRHGVVDSPSSTSPSLLSRARVGDTEAWHRLVEIYGPVVYRWGRTAGLQDSDASDVMQDVFRDVARGLAKFRKEKPGDSFRGWLWVIARNRIRQHFNRLNRQPVGVGGTAHAEQINSAQDYLAADALPDEGSVRAAVVHRALELIRDEFQERTWQAFWRLTVTGQSAAEIAGELKLNEKAVRQAKYRVLCRLREMLRDD
jgi:RNA polymerase sigma-70 factor, ECF subfamily